MSSAVATGAVPTDRPLFIVSLGYRAAARWARANGLSSRQWKHVDTPDDLLGRSGIRVVWLGPVWERGDFQKLCELVDAGQANGSIVTDRRGIKANGKARTKNRPGKDDQTGAAA